MERSDSGPEALPVLFRQTLFDDELPCYGGSRIGTRMASDEKWSVFAARCPRNVVICGMVGVPNGSETSMVSISTRSI
jgi:hypothetical protein